MEVVKEISKAIKREGYYLYLEIGKPKDFIMKTHDKNDIINTNCGYLDVSPLMNMVKLWLATGYYDSYFEKLEEYQEDNSVILDAINKSILKATEETELMFSELELFVREEAWYFWYGKYKITFERIERLYKKLASSERMKYLFNIADIVYNETSWSWDDKEKFLPKVRFNNITI